MRTRDEFFIINGSIYQIFGRQAVGNKTTDRVFFCSLRKDAEFTKKKYNQ
jgi:hypothetical protein